MTRSKAAEQVNTRTLSCFKEGQQLSVKLIFSCVKSLSGADDPSPENPHWISEKIFTYNYIIILLGQLKKHYLQLSPFSPVLPLRYIIHFIAPSSTFVTSSGQNGSLYT